MPRLGDVESSEALIRELYIELRRRVNVWAEITKQTAQARMGYIGQHLVSIATGYPGGRSGARGKDLVISDHEFGEIKTCYRVDQLGSCLNCGAVVASIERSCHSCDSEKILRKDDSKWLIGIRNEAEYAEILQPKYYYFVLFEFEDLSSPDIIVASIWRVNPRAPGFAYALIDYNENIKSNSTSGAPLNIWPYQLKFQLMRPCLIYRSKIYLDDTVVTEIFPHRDDPVPEAMVDLAEFSRSRNFTNEKVLLAAETLGVGKLEGPTKRHMMIELLKRAEQKGIGAGDFTDAIATSLYRLDIEEALPRLPELLRRDLEESGLL